MSRAIRQIYRGCCALPHVGSHPGSGTAIALIAAGALAGVPSAQHSIVGALLMAAFVLPIYFLGAYDRAEEADRND